MRFYKTACLLCAVVSSVVCSSVAAAAPEKILVAYFSRAGENYGVGNITEGNTEIVAKMIAAKTGADLFKIEPVTPYPESYDECTALARTELDENQRPPIKEPLPNPQDYDLVFLGGPVWWGKFPMCVNTFLDDFSLKGKDTVIFVTHEGSGLGNIPSEIAENYGASVNHSFEMTGVTAQTDREEAQKLIEGWLSSMKLLSLK